MAARIIDLIDEAVAMVAAHLTIENGLDRPFNLSMFREGTRVVLRITPDAQAGSVLLAQASALRGLPLR